MRRIAALLGSCALAGLGFFGFVGSAQAAPLSASTATCNGTAYPFQPAATIMAGATAVKPGQVIEVSGVHYCADDTVTLTINGVDVGAATTNSVGAFDPAVTVPAGVGATTQLCGAGAVTPTAGSNSDCITLTNTAYTAGGSTSGSGTAVTGVDIALMVGAAVVLIGGGVALAVAGRRRGSRAGL